LVLPVLQAQERMSLALFVAVLASELALVVQAMERLLVPPVEKPKLGSGPQTASVPM
jgi:hypothetical protein